jgi:hypothetical protein
MSPRTIRRLLAGFVLGAFAGWVAGLLRSPQDAPAGSSAADAASLPQERFGQPAGDARAPSPTSRTVELDLPVDVKANESHHREPAMSVAPAPSAPETTETAQGKGVKAAKATKPARPKARQVTGQTPPAKQSKAAKGTTSSAAAAPVRRRPAGQGEAEPAAGG